MFASVVQYVYTDRRRIAVIWSSFARQVTAGTRRLGDDVTFERAINGQLDADASEDE